MHLYIFDNIHDGEYKVTLLHTKLIYIVFILNRLNINIIFKTDCGIFRLFLYSMCIKCISYLKVGARFNN